MVKLVIMADNKQNFGELNEPIEIHDRIYWVGFYDEKTKMQCNPYLIIDGEEAILIDPGSIPHFPVVARKIFSLVKPEQISHIVLQHEDPDICGAMPLYIEMIGRPDVKVVCARPAYYFITHYDIKSPYYLSDENNNLLTLKSGRTLRFVDAPYLHTPGVIMTYDEKSKILFSSDVFGSLEEPAEWRLFADESYPPRLTEMMESYMPSKEAVLYTLKKLEGMNIETIAPQHGSIIKSEPEVKKYIEICKNLNYGILLK